MTCIRLSIVGLALLVVSGCHTAGLLSAVDYRPDQPVRNVIFVVGDGMGLAQITAGMYARDNTSVFEQFPVVGLIKTHSADELITDSAAGATAFSCGQKTYNGAIAVDSNRQPLRTIFEEGDERGYGTGVVVTSTLTHATPAAFYAHDESRSNYEAIAEDLVLSGLDVAIGYGKEEFNARKDARDLLAVLSERGFKVQDNLEEVDVRKRQRQFVGLPGVDPPRFSERPKDFLSRGAVLALDQLKANKEPFILVLEGSQIDWAGHANDTEYLIGEMLDFESALQAVLRWAEKDGETLVVVTADHETGGLTLTGGDLSTGAIAANYSSKQHTAVMVPVFAFGPAATLFSGMYDNTAIHSKLRRALGWE
ncbi:MAG: alkaline phosphatase [Bacteroidetes bacterium]|nr:alkaline phosphatase [Bacteroidota bacterium]